jgi:hypothetical protein
MKMCQKHVLDVQDRQPRDALLGGGGDSTHHAGPEVDEIRHAVDDNRGRRA